MHRTGLCALTASTSAADPASLTDEARELDRVTRLDTGVVNTARRPGRLRSASSSSLESSAVVGDGNVSGGSDLDGSCESARDGRRAPDVAAVAAGGGDVSRGSDLDECCEGDWDRRRALVESSGGGGGDGGGERDGWRTLREEACSRGSSSEGCGDSSDVLMEELARTEDLVRIPFGVARVAPSSCLTPLLIGEKSF